ncbi:methyl-accepting chemotaxis protein [Celerinatantimonas sp. MCCC 1A17872]|uniref:methyl-accepting chemotaxis protein n=1 Tax=Celerinatantimonas sp. MCCC 1A17872 TaxID=3177514 RepID=UPI0038C31332
MMLKQLNKSLLRLILLATALLIAVQTIAIGFSSFIQIKQLQASIQQSLSQQTQSMQKTLKQNQEQQIADLHQTTQTLSEELNQSLTQLLNQQQQAQSQRQMQAFKDEADNYNQLIVTSSIEAVLDNDLGQMTDLILAAQKNPNVIVAAFVSPKGQLLTHSLDRSKPRVQQLDIKGKGNRALERVINAAQQDPEIYFTKTPIKFQGGVIAQLDVAYNMGNFMAEQKKIQADSAKARQSIVAHSQQLLAQMSQSSQQGLNVLASSLLKMNQKNTADLTSALTRLSHQITQKTIAIQIGGGILLLAAIGILLVIRVQKRIQNLSSSLSKLAKGGGDLTQTIPTHGEDEIAHMGNSINRFLQTTRKLIQKVNDNGQSSQQSISQLSVRSDHAFDLVSHQNQSLEEINAAMRESSQAVDEQTQAVLDIQHHVDTLRQTNQQNQQISGRVSSLIHQLDDEIESANQQVANFVNLSEEIATVLNVIQTIAEQTNLLALNAAIEAARAGDHGRGFAVVADEVRQLAAKTQDSTGKIQHSIDALSEGANSAAQAMAQATQRAKQSNDELSEEENIRQNVSQAVNALAQLIDQIAAMAEEQNATSTQVAQTSEQMHQQSQQAMQAVSDTREQSQKLNQLSKQLVDAMSAFTV